MAHVLEGLRVLEMVGDHGSGVVGRSVRVACGGGVVLLLVLIVAVLLAHEVLGALVLVGAAILRDLSAMPLSAIFTPEGRGPTYW